MDAVGYSYDPMGNRLSMVEPIGATSYVHNALNRLRSVSFSGNQPVSYQYHFVGNRNRLTYSGGKWVNYTHDTSCRLLTGRD